MLVTSYNPWHWNPVGHQLLCIQFRGFQQLSEVLMIGVLIITQLPPLSDLGPVMNHHIEERIKEQDKIRRNRTNIQQYWNRWTIKRILEKRRLNHYKRSYNSLAVQHEPEKSSLVRSSVTDINELRSPQVKHKLGIERKVGG
ncbi:hypothetical protein V8G54_018546 [Vigna mungo]|uniref:Uncharacterized protein n=1 Tax=Vigna mungo TaxID=3915 RepID=A0AAQ3NA32_VIGMU